MQNLYTAFYLMHLQYCNCLLSSELAKVVKINIEIHTYYAYKIITSKTQITTNKTKTRML